VSVAELEGLWFHALDTAVTAVHDGELAETLDPDFCVMELRRIRAEREWLAHFTWPERRRGRPASVVRRSADPGAARWRSTG
jgi:hypothetical protein